MNVTTIATLATGVVIEDLRVLLKSLEIFNVKPPTVYLLCDSAINKALPRLKYAGRLVVKEGLNEYAGLNRAAMEAMPGKNYSTLFFDFTMEKVQLLKWVLQNESEVLFCDADICFLAPLPEIPVNSLVALSPHMIRGGDEAKYGKYNAGFMWFANMDAVLLWEKACATSRFFEQAALEDVAVAFGHSLHLFPVTQNYGWWRLWQGEESPQALLKKWSVKRQPMTAGISIEGVTLGSVHTHFCEKKDPATTQFNQIVTGMLYDIHWNHLPAKQLLSALGKI
jgi:hypothetical protein